MALDPLATAADLAKHLQRELTPAESAAAEPALLAASAAVRNAAGIPFTEMTTTVALHGDGCWLPLPFRPVVSIISVVIDSTPVTDYTLCEDQLFRAAGWPSCPG